MFEVALVVVRLYGRKVNKQQQHSYYCAEVLFECTKSSSLVDQRMGVLLGYNYRYIVVLAMGICPLPQCLELVNSHPLYKQIHQLYHSENCWQRLVSSQEHSTKVLKHRKTWYY